MDKVAELKETDIPLIVFPTVGIFVPLLEEKREEILGIPRRTFKYGETDRHKLDIYYPPNVAPGTKTKILFFIYGGGFASGERVLPPPADLGYANLAAYFAQKGFIVVIPDYRLVPNVKYPGPAEDVRDAMEWVVTHPEHLVFASVTLPDTDAIFVLGHSAGATHIFTVLAHPDLYSSLLHPKIKGAILFSGVYHYQPHGLKTGLEEVAVQYWGSLAETHKNDPLALLERIPSDGSLPNILLLEADLDPEWLKVVGNDFQEELIHRFPKLKVKKIVAKGHNHISVTWCLGTGQGEEWAEEAAEWIEEQ